MLQCLQPRYKDLFQRHIVKVINGQETCTTLAKTKGVNRPFVNCIYELAYQGLKLPVGRYQFGS